MGDKKASEQPEPTVSLETDLKDEPKQAGPTVSINLGGGKWIEIPSPRKPADIPGAAVQRTVTLKDGTVVVITRDAQKFRFEK